MHLTHNDIISIREQYRAGKPIDELANDQNIDMDTIERLVQGTQIANQSWSKRMPNRPPSLANNMHKAAYPDVELEEDAEKPTPVKKKPAGDKSYLTPSRRGQKVISIYVDPEVFKQFKMLALDLDLNGEALMYEAINDLFRKYDMPPIALKTARNGISV